MSVQETKPLVDYGIMEEQSDYRVHVCFGEPRLYIYPTTEGVKCCKSGNYPLVSAHQSGVSGATAEGYLVPPGDIKFLKRVDISRLLRWIDCKKTDSPEKKGQKAVELTLCMLKRGWLPIPLGAEEIGDQDLQISGCDIQIKANIRLQVKCDYDGGRDGSGYLFLQTRECNPNHRH